MAAEKESGSQAASIGTEHTLNGTTPETTDGVYQLWIDTSAMANGDTLEVRIKEKVRSSGTQRLVWLDTLAHTQDEPGWCSPALILLHGWDMTIKQTAGTGRTFEWSIRSA